MRRPSPYAASPPDPHPPQHSMRLAQINLSAAHSPYARMPYTTMLTQRAPAGRRRRSVHSGTALRANTRPASATVRSPHAAHGVARAVWIAAAAPPGAYQHATPARPATARPQQQQQQQQPLSARTPSRPASARPSFAPSPPSRPAPVAARPSPPAAAASPTLHEIHRPRRKHHASSDFAPERSSVHAAYHLAAEPVQPAFATRPAFHPLLSAQPNPEHARVMQMLDQQLRNPLIPDRYEATFDTEEHDAPDAVASADPPPAAAPEALSPSTAAAMLGIGGGGGGSARRPPKRPAASAAAAASFFDRPLPLLQLPMMPVPPPPLSPPEGWSAVPSPLAIDEDSTKRPLPFQVDWARELMLATGPADLIGVASPPSRTASTGPEADAEGQQSQQLSPQQQQQQQWQPTEAPESSPPAPSQPLSVVPLFILQRRERERAAQEQRRAREASLAAAPAPVPPLSFVSPPAEDDADDAAYEDDFDFEQKEESVPVASAAAPQPKRPSSARHATSTQTATPAAAAVHAPLLSASGGVSSRRPSSARPAANRPASVTAVVQSPRYSSTPRAPQKPSAAGHNDDAAIAFFTSEQPASPMQGRSTIASQAPFFNVRAHRGKRKPLSGK